MNKTYHYGITKSFSSISYATFINMAEFFICHLWLYKIYQIKHINEINIVLSDHEKNQKQNPQVNYKV